MSSIDLEDAYLLVPIHSDDRKYLCFEWKRIIYQYTCLPFGSSTASYVFTKIIKPIVTFLRKKSFHSIIYLDDFLLLESNFSDCSENVRQTILLLQYLGFLIHFKKSELTPSQKCKYLGFIFNSVKKSISKPTEKREKLLKLVKKYQRKKNVKLEISLV